MASGTIKNIGGLSYTSSWLTAYTNAHSLIIVVGRGSNGTAYVSQSVTVPKSVISSTKEYFACGGSAGYFIQIGLTKSSEPTSADITLRSSGTDLTNRAIYYYYD